MCLLKGGSWSGALLMKENNLKKMGRSAGEVFLKNTFKIGSKFSRFNPKFDIFNRAIWDDDIDPKSFFVSYDIANYKPKKSKGFDHWDYALRNASWHLTDFIGERDFSKTGTVEGFSHFFTTQTSGPKAPVVLQSPSETAAKIKTAAQLLGAGAVGIASLDKRWVYSHTYNRKTGENKAFDLPERFKYAIVLIMPMDYQLGRTFPSALSGSTTGMGYAHSLQSATMLAQFITNLGYQAIASLNDTALNIPLAIKAGLGEYGRHGLLISRKYGPNVRIAKVFTDLPLQPDSPKTFGVAAFCQICRKCSNACPAKAIEGGDAKDEPPNISSLRYIKKWTVNAEKCFKFWVGMNSDCAICIRVCPYNKDYRKWWHRIGIKLAGTFLRRIMLWLDDLFRYGRRILPNEWWRKKMNTFQ